MMLFNYGACDSKQSSYSNDKRRRIGLVLARSLMNKVGDQVENWALYHVQNSYYDLISELGSSLKLIRVRGVVLGQGIHMGVCQSISALTTLHHRFRSCCP